jgi:hypothetical protein
MPEIFDILRVFENIVYIIGKNNSYLIIRCEKCLNKYNFKYCL